ncbi:YbaK/EbsC family protein [Streptomyces milbemycinicus]|uniref:YbaK/EbsC family protein n=1 Tax=Streptomyces milbemycinicus TaxID=476552 RepID=A0ABW8M4H0_9ACTN
MAVRGHALRQAALGGPCSRVASPGAVTCDGSVRPARRRLNDLASREFSRTREYERCAPFCARTAAPKKWSSFQLGHLLLWGQQLSSAAQWGAVANSLFFCVDGEPLLVLTSGSHRAGTRLVARLLGVGRCKIRRADPEFVLAMTGQEVGGVAPVGHPRAVRTLVDVALEEHPQVWAGAGMAHTVFRTTFTELVKLTGGEAAVVAADLTRPTAPCTPTRRTSAHTTIPHLITLPPPGGRRPCQNGVAREWRPVRTDGGDIVGLR